VRCGSSEKREERQERVRGRQCEVRGQQSANVKSHLQPRRESPTQETVRCSERGVQRCVRWQVARGRRQREGGAWQEEEVREYR